MPKIKICIVDDNKAVCEALGFLFDTYYELKVSVYHDPLLFLEECTSEWQGIVLIDLYMPSISGLEVLRVLKKRSNTMNALIMSGHASPGMTSQVLKAGADGFILKPFKIDALLAQIDRILNQVTF